MTQIATLDVDSALEDLDGDLELYAELLEVFLDDTPGIVRDMKTGLSNGENELVERSAHSLKSSSRLVGGKRLSNLAADLEENARNGTLENGENAVRSIDEEFQRLLQTVEKAEAN